MRRVVSRIATLVAMAALAAGVALAQTPFQKKADLAAAVQKLAAGIHEQLKLKGQSAVSVGDFSGPNKLKVNIAARLKADLERELKSLKVSVADNAKLEVRGDYALVEDPNERDLHALDLNVRFINTDTNKEIAGLNLEAFIKDNSDIAKMAGATVALSPKADRLDRNKGIYDAVETPTVAIANTKIRATPNSPYAVELLVGRDSERAGPPRPVVVRDGRAFVPIERNEYYQIRLHNSASHDSAVTLTIDGLDMYTFSDDVDRATGKSRFQHVVVPAGKAGTVKGWHKTIGTEGKGQVFAFVVTALGRGAASQKKATGSVGVITVTFAAAWPKGSVPPADETDGSRSAAGNETGVGPTIDATMKAVEREIGVVREVVSIRYVR
ncbi:MAG: hypothetical protein U0746_01150 [Gemmataceae bacterium]